MSHLLAMPELLAPAGSMESLLVALHCGASAVYVGAKRFSARSSAENFNSDALRTAARYSHLHGAKLYLAVNTLLYEAEWQAFDALLCDAVESGIDACIVQDFGAAVYLRKRFPTLPLHASTQMTIHTSGGLTIAKEMGLRRVVLARELSLTEIAELRAKTNPALELEAFVHGAMCMSISGRCLLSEYLTGRDANRGACAQSCRWNYRLVEEKRPGQYFPIGEDETGSYILNAKDLCILPYLDQLYAAGVTSFKIEGRAKAFYYVAGVANAYRMAIDALFAEPPQPIPDWVLEELETVSHRPYSTGFFFGQPQSSIHHAENSYIRSYGVVGVAQEWRDGRLYVQQRNRFFEGDVIELFLPKQKPIVLTVSDLQNADSKPIESANHAMMDCSLRCEIPVPADTILRKRLSETI